MSMPINGLPGLRLSAEQTLGRFPDTRRREKTGDG
jgi:hypothetical protein